MVPSPAWQGVATRQGPSGVLGREVGEDPVVLLSGPNKSRATSRVGASGSWRTAGPAVGAGGEEREKGRGGGEAPLAGISYPPHHQPPGWPAQPRFGGGILDRTTDFTNLPTFLSHHSK